MQPDAGSNLHMLRGADPDANPFVSSTLQLPQLHAEGPSGEAPGVKEQTSSEAEHGMEGPPTVFILHLSTHSTHCTHSTHICTHALPVGHLDCAVLAH